MYYTIDEQNQNFTLPAGDIYGMITNLQDNSANTSLTNLTNGLANVICTTAPTTASTASAQRPAVVVENYVNGTSGYFVRSDGYCEQWGRTQMTTKADTIVDFLKPFINTNYIPSYIVERYTSTQPVRTDDVSLTINSVTNSYITFYLYDAAGDSYSAYVRWKVSGYIK